MAGRTPAITVASITLRRLRNQPGEVAHAPQVFSQYLSRLFQAVGGFWQSHNNQSRKISVLGLDQLREIV